MTQREWKAEGVSKRCRCLLIGERLYANWGKLWGQTRTIFKSFFENMFYFGLNMSIPGSSGTIFEYFWNIGDPCDAMRAAAQERVITHVMPNRFRTKRFPMILNPLESLAMQKTCFPMMVMLFCHFQNELDGLRTVWVIRNKHYESIWRWVNIG